MSTLEELLPQQINVTASVLRRALFHHPQRGLLQSLALKEGEAVAKRALAKLSAALRVPLLSVEQLAIDESLLKGHEQALASLCYAFRAAPLDWLEINGQRTLRIAMCDPLDENAQLAFARLYQVPVTGVLTCEEHLLDALQKRIGPPALRYHRAPQLFAGESKQQYETLRTLLIDAINAEVKAIELEVIRDQVKFQFCFSHDRFENRQLIFSPEEFFALISARSEVDFAQNRELRGRCHFELLPSAIDAIVEFSLSRRIGGKLNPSRLRISELNVRSRGSNPLWLGQSRSAWEAFRGQLDEGTGLYALTVSYPEDRPHCLSALQARYPDAILLSDVKELNTELLKYSAHSHVFVVIESMGVAPLLRALAAAPQVLRLALAGIASYVRVPRVCPLCVVDCQADVKTIQLLPEGVSISLDALKYPRGCPVCSKSGYLGAIGFVEFLSLKAQLGELFRQGVAGEQLVAALSHSGFKGFVHHGVEAIGLGLTTVEMLAKTLFRRHHIPTAQFLAISKKLTEQEVSNGGATAPIDDSPLRKEPPLPRSSGQYHSVVLKADEGLLDSREALQKEQRQALFGGREESNIAAKRDSEALKVDDLLMPDESSNVWGDLVEPSRTSPAPAAKKGSNPFHSVVLELDNETTSMRDLLRKEFDEKK